MIPESLLKFNCAHGLIVPRYLDERDYPWLRLLIEEYLRFIDAPKIELIRHLKKPLPFVSPLTKRRLAIQALNGLFKAEIKSKIQPRKIREALFEAAASSGDSREIITARVAQDFGMSEQELEASLFCDLPNERRLQKPKIELNPNLLVLRANTLLIQSFLSRAISVDIQLEGNARIVVRQAKLRGLICELSQPTGPGNVTLSVSGPYALFRHTLLYGQALGQLLPQLAWCNRFQLRARCLVDERESHLEVSSGDPVCPSKAPKQFDSQLEAKFARSFLKTMKGWDLIREPEPVKADETLIFPDFLLREKDNPANAWFVEIVGFWMPEYLQKKIAQLKKTNLKNFIICVNSSLNCSETDFPKNANIVQFKNWIDPESIRAIIECNTNAS
ncbi:MAG: DUF790 family protein [Deltaproteobacteria bacterium]|nr:DUF790 family protein [Deltaproteobacteria bacterium]